MRVGLATDVGSRHRLQPAAHPGRRLFGQPGRAAQRIRPARLLPRHPRRRRGLYLDEFIGNFSPGQEADFVVLDWAATPELDWRMERTQSLAERLFALMILGDERCVVATYVMGERVFQRIRPGY